MFTDIRTKELGITHVRGGSWLYNLEAYCRLFPPQFTATAQPNRSRNFGMALWGQFLNRHHQIRTEMAASFLSRVERQTTLDGLIRCFPYQVLYPQCAIEHFYEFLDI